MRSTILQPWITVRSSGANGVVQDVEGWLDVGTAQDATVWVDVRGYTLPGGSNPSIGLTVESSPTRDEGCFVAVTPATALVTTSSPIVLKTVRAASTSVVARYLRWRLTPTGGSGTWDVTFRVRVALSQTAYFTPTQIAGCALWLRSDLGIALGGSTVSAWNDQSGNGANASPGVAPSYSTIGGVKGYPRLSATGTQWLKGTLNPSVTAHTAFSVLTFSGTGVNGSMIAGTNSSLNVNTAWSQFYYSPGPTGYARVSSSAALNSDFTKVPYTLPTTCAIFSTAGDAANVDFFQNGLSVGTASVSVTPAAAANYVVMALDNTLQYPLVGDAYEYLVYNRVLTATERLVVHRYLGGRYGIVVP